MNCQGVRHFSLAFLVAAISVWGFGRSECARASDPPAKQPDAVRVAAILPLTGEGAAYGKDMQKAIELATEVTNKEWSAKGRELAVIYEDDGGKPATGVSALRKVITADHCRYVVGGVFSSVALALVPAADAEGVLLFSPSASSPKLAGMSKLFFRNWPSDVFDGVAMAEFAHKQLGLKKIGILYENSEYGVGLKSTFTEKLKELGGEVSSAEAYLSGDADFRSQITNIVRSQTPALYLLGYYKEFALILRQARQLGFNGRILSCVSFDEPKVLELAGEAAEGVIFTRPYYDPSSDRQDVRRFVEEYTKRAGKEPTVFAAHAYDAVRILSLALDEAGPPYDPQAVAQRIRHVQAYPGVSGMTSFMETNEVVKQPQLMVVKNGKFVPYK